MADSRTMRQMDIFTDLPIGRRLELLRDLQLTQATVGNASVSGVVQKAVLRAIHDRQGARDCFASQRTLAMDVNSSVSQVARAIKSLIAQDLITVEPGRTKRHRVVWSSVGQHVAKNPRPSVREDGPTSVMVTEPNEPTSVMVTGHIGHGDRGTSVMVTGHIGHGDRLNLKETSNETSPPNPEAWVEVVRDLVSWGLVSASSACSSAAGRGWSVEYVREIHASIVAGSIPAAMQPGRLANVLSGRVDPPFGSDEVADRQAGRKTAVERATASRDLSDAKEADVIRDRARYDARGRSVPDWVIDAVACRRMREAGLSRFCTPGESASLERLGQQKAEVQV